MAVSAGVTDKEAAIEGPSKLRTGALMLIIAALIAGAGALMAIPVVLGAVAGGPAGLVAGLALVLAVVLVGIIIMLVALFAFVVPGASRLAHWNTEFSSPSKLIRV